MAPIVEVTLVDKNNELVGTLKAVKHLDMTYGKTPNPKATVALRKNGERVTTRNAVHRTRVFRQTSNPAFDFNFSIPLPADRQGLTLEIRIHSHDTITSTPIAVSILSLDDVPKTSEDAKCRRWYYLTKKETKNETSEVMFREPSLYQNYSSAHEKSQKNMETETKMDDAVIRGYVRVKPIKKGYASSLYLTSAQWPLSYISVTIHHLNVYEVDMDNTTEATLLSVHNIKDVRNVKSEDGKSHFSVELAGGDSDNYRIHFHAVRSEDKNEWMNAIHDIVGSYGKEKGDGDEEKSEVGTVVQLPGALQLAPQYENTAVKFITYRCADEEYVLSGNNLELCGDDWKDIRLPMYVVRGGPLVVYLEDGQNREIPADDLANNTETSVKMGASRDLLVEWSIQSENTDKKGKLRAAGWCGLLATGLLSLGAPNCIDARMGFFLLLILTIIKSIMTVMESTTKVLVITKMAVQDRLGMDEIDTNGPMLMLQDSARIERVAWGKWANATCDHMKLRGPNYLADRVKIPAGNHMFRCVDIELSEVEEKVTNASATSPLIDQWRADHPAVDVATASDEEVIKNMIFVTSWQIPASPWYCLGNYFVFDQQQAGNELFPVFCRTLKKFVDSSDVDKKKKFKLIPRVIEGPWIVKSAVGTTPAILGKKLDIIFYYDKARNVFEVEIDVSSSAAAGQILKLVKGATKSLVIDLNVLIEAQGEDELPEVLLGGARLFRPNLDKLPKGRPTN